MTVCDTRQSAPTSARRLLLSREAVAQSREKSLGETWWDERVDFASIAGLVSREHANDGGSAIVIPRLIDAPD